MAGSIRASDRAERAPRWKVLRRAARARLALFGAAVMILAALIALAAPLVAPYDPLAQNLGNTLAAPGRDHLLGTDNVGRDVLSRVIWGTRVSLVAGLGSTRGAERDQSHHRAGVAERGLRDPRRSVALIPRARHPAPTGLVGQHDQRRPRLSAAGALDRLRAGRGALRDRGGIELRRRCGARRARSPDARVGER